MQYEVRMLERSEWPELLAEIPDAPEKLNARGSLPRADTRLLAVVGSRTYTPYGKQVCEQLIGGLAHHDVGIVSGLALGIDGIAHRAALRAGLYTLAVPGSGLGDRVLYPATHRALAHEILEAGGGMISEFEPDFRAQSWSFPKRNRIMAGMCHVTLIVEATLKSGTLITARLAADYFRDVAAVPGPVHAPTSAGPHMLLKRGAALIESADDLVEVLGLVPQTSALPFQPDLSDSEKQVLALLDEPMPRDLMVARLGLAPSAANALLAELELKGLVVERLGRVCRA